MKTTTTIKGITNNTQTFQKGDVYKDKDGNLAVVCKNSAGWTYLVYFTGSNAGNAVALNDNMVFVNHMNIEVF